MANIKLNEMTVCEHTDRAHLTITLRCNNNCLFCLQGHHPNDFHRNFEEIKSEIDIAASNNVDKIILSGGEPTIHPDFLKLVKYCKSKRFRQIQVISNGRLFSIKKFTDVVCKSGLTEVTLSIHGKNAETHDLLVNSPGAFNQILKAIKNLKEHNILISVDVGIFSQNYNQLLEIVELIYNKLDLKGDIDLIGPTMQGSAFENKSEVMPDYEKVEPYLKKALEFCRNNNVVCWVLRVPLEYMEGYEFYKQDNNKLVEKSLSIQKSLRHLPPDCYGEKCAYCRTKPVCDVLVNLNNSLSNSSDNRIRVVVDSIQNFENNILNYSTFNISELIFLEKPSKQIIDICLKLDYVDKILLKNIFDDELIDYVESIKSEKFVFLFDYSDIDSSKLLFIDSDLVKSKLKSIVNSKKELNIIITEKNYRNILSLIESILDYKVDKVNFTSFSVYDFVKRDISWETGMKLLDTNNLVLNLFKLEKYILDAISYCINNNILFSIKEIPFCVFSDDFYKNNKDCFERNYFFNTLTIDSIDEHKEFHLPKYIKYVYNTIFRERIKDCKLCPHINDCAGFDDMYLKIHSLRRN
jgi:MoaA/NifB/PqqE/SkfB family radical SAM enzyme